MDAITKLSLEIDGITGTIIKYSGEPFLRNATKKLKENLDKRKMAEIIYLLEELSGWYWDNQNKIQTNDYVINSEIHLKTEKKINEYIKSLKQIKIENDLIGNRNVNLKDPLETGETVKKVFISHSSKDKSVCEAFVEFLEAIGIKEEIILFSSSSRHGIPAEMDIFEYLRGNLSNGITVYYMLSDNYYQSPYCLNEMGAAWVKQNDFSVFILPNLTQGITGVINNGKKGFTLDDSFDLIQLKNKLSKEFELTISEGKFDSEKSKFLKKLGEH
jgi:hypothetical protein